MILLRHNEPVQAQRDLFVQMVDIMDCITPRTGLEVSVQMVKPGGTAYGACGATVQEIGAGTYRLRFSISDLDTPGMAMLRIFATGALDQYVPVQVVGFIDEVHLAKAALVNARSHVVGTGVNQIKDDDQSTILRTLTPSESNGVITVTVA